MYICTPDFISITAPRACTVAELVALCRRRTRRLVWKAKPARSTSSVAMTWDGCIPSYVYMFTYIYIYICLYANCLLFQPFLMSSSLSFLRSDIFLCFSTIHYWLTIIFNHSIAIDNHTQL